MKIPRTFWRTHGERERGYVAVELGLILMALSGILALTFVYGRAFWQYNAASNAAYGAARYLSASGQWSTLGNYEARKEATDAMFRTLAAGSGLDTDPANMAVTVSCPASCTGATFDEVTIDAATRLADPFGVWPADSWVPARSVAVNTN